MINRFYVVAFVVVLGLSALASAQTFTTLYAFTGGSDGGHPFAALIQDQAGNLYGTTSSGGDYQCGNNSCGVVFKVDTAGQETVLHQFAGHGDGGVPFAPLIQDSEGNLYGTTRQGGRQDGAVFKIDTAGHETVLYGFRGGARGCSPSQGLIMDKAGNMYGTSGCGTSGFYGTVFKLTPQGKETVLHQFRGGSSDGAVPLYGHLIMDKVGNLHGVTQQGGGADYCNPYGYHGCGVLYKLTKRGKLTVLHSFAGGTSDGCVPYGTVATDSAGNLYGTTSQCGSNLYGTVWEVGKNGVETILHNFAGSPMDGAFPVGGVVLDSNGNLYGNAAGGGAYGYGVLWELSPGGTLTILHSFDSTDPLPYDEVLRATNGELFGVTSGNSDAGTVWSYVP